MTYTTGDIERFVSPIRHGEHDWDAFIGQLEELAEHNVGLWMPKIGEAFLVDTEQQWGDDESFFVFRIQDGQGSRTFRVTADSYSFGGIGHGRLEEVTETTVVKRAWEAL